MLEKGKIYSLHASAGSGKTTSIVQNMIEVLFQPGQSHRHILGMTFTNKAAHELKKKLLQSLANLATGTNKLPIGLIGTSEELREKAYHLWIRILHDYSSLKISTLDKFFLSLVRSYSKELGIHIGFKTALETEEILKEAIQNIFNYLDTDQQSTLSQVLTQFALEKVKEGKSWKIEYELEKIGARLFSDDDFPYISILLGLDFEQTSALLQQTQQEIQRFENNIGQLHQEFQSLMSEKEWNIDDFSYKKRGFGGLGIRIEAAKKTKDYSKVLNSITLAQLENGTFAKTKGSAYYDIQNCEEIPELLQKTILTFQSYGKYLLYKSIRNNMHSLSLLQVLALEVQNLKLQKNIVLVSDTNKLIATAHLTEETNFLFWKIAERYTHYFLDEFQDTNILQYFNLLPLLKEIPAQVSGNALIVGDGKQAIYRWRGGNADYVYTHLHSDLNPIQDSLASNWRSAPEIVHFNNQLFTHISQFPELKEVSKHFAHVVQKAERTQEGSVKIIALRPEPNLSETDRAIQKTLQYIEEILASGTFFADDIAIIVRKNTEAQMIAKALQEQGYPVRSAEAFILNNHPKVQWIITAFQWITNPDDRLALLQLSVLQQQLFSASQVISWNEKNTEWIENQIHELGKLSSIQAYEELVIRLGLSVESDAYLIRLGDVIREFCTENNPSIPAFLLWWKEAKKKTTLIQSGTGAIQILTIHKSKGLQFPVVILPFADWKVSPKPQSFTWFSSPKVLNQTPVLISVHSKLLESEAKDCLIREYQQTAVDNLNLLYVAFTRAEKHMCIILRTGITEVKAQNDIEKYKNCADWILRALPPTQTIEETAQEQQWLYGKLPEFSTVVTAPAAAKDTIFIYPVAKKFQDKITIRQKALEYWPGEEHTRAEALALGVLIHQVLEKITDIHSIQPSVQKIVDEGLVLSKEAENIQNMLYKRLSQPDLYPYFDGTWEVWNEREFVVQQKIYRPDRVQKKGTQILIMDYKTGKSRDENKAQLQIYFTHIQTLYPHHNIRACLLYFLENQIEWLDKPLVND